MLVTLESNPKTLPPSVYSLQFPPISLKLLAFYLPRTIWISNYLFLFRFDKHCMKVLGLLGGKEILIYRGGGGG